MQSVDFINVVRTKRKQEEEEAGRRVRQVGTVMMDCRAERTARSERVRRESQETKGAMVEMCRRNGLGEEEEEEED